MSSKLWLAAAALCLASACESTNPMTGSTDPGFGEAVKYNMAIQVINPDPVYDEDGAQPGENGDVAARAVKRYRTGQVKTLESQTTTETTGPAGPR